jgi:hypothetical protein
MSATLDALIAENRELRRELALRDERLRAIERSRWWRVHPRRFLPARSARADSRQPTERTMTESSDVAMPSASTAPMDDPSLASFFADVLARGSFTEDWVTTRFAKWRPVIDELQGRPTRILEIGSFEGLSACFLLWRLPLASITCVDPFVGIPEHAGMESDDLERTFDSNVALVDATRVRKLVGDSKRRLLDLLEEEDRFDLVYVDGSHLGLDVLVDAALSWQLVAPSGVVVFDDYRWAYLGEDPLLRPGKAIDAFCALLEGKHEVVFADDQIALRRIS